MYTSTYPDETDAQTLFEKNGIIIVHRERTEFDGKPYEWLFREKALRPDITKKNDIIGTTGEIASKLNR